MLYLTILLLGFLLAGWNVVRTLRRSGTIALGLDPSAWFSMFFAIIHLLVPAMKFALEKYRYQWNYPYDTMVLDCSFIIIAYNVAALLANFLSMRAVDQEFANAKKTIKIDKYFVIILFAGLAFVGGIIAAIINYSQLDNDVIADRISGGVGNGFLRAMPNLLLSAVLLSLYVLLQEKRKPIILKLASVILLILSFLAALWYYNSINSRNSIFVMLIFVGTLFLVLRPMPFRLTPKLVKKALSVFLIAGFALFAAKQMTDDRYSGNSDYAEEHRENAFYYMLDGAFGNDENILWLSDNYYDLQWGDTYYAAFANFIPRDWWPDKPLGGGPILRNMIYPGSYVVGAEGNTSFTTGLFTESYMNFGLFGVMLIPIVWAFVASYLARRTARALGSVAVLPWLIGTLIWSTMLLYAEFLGLIARSIFILTPFIFVAYFGTKTKYLKKSSTYNNSQKLQDGL